MEVVDNKYKKWGWGALAGLVVVMIIAAIVIGVSMKSTPVKTVEGNADSTKVADNTPSNSNSNKKTEDEGRDNEGDAKKEENNNSANSGNSNNSNSGNANNGNANNGTNNGANNSGNSNNTNNSGNANNSSKMPKTGPEDDMIAFVAWAAIAGLGAYYFLNVKKNA